MKIEDETWSVCGDPAHGDWVMCDDGQVADFSGFGAYEADVARARLAACAPEAVRLLRRITKYAREDRATTPGVTRLARALEEAEAIIRKALGE